MPKTPDSILALDVGDKRIGVAIANLVAQLPRPLTTLENNGDFIPALQAIIDQEAVGSIVIGLPRGMQGQTTQQTTSTEEFASKLRQQIAIPISFQDEAMTSHKAEAELNARGGDYDKADIDALAATYILEDFLTEQRRQAAV